MYDREYERTYDASNEGERLLYVITFFPWYFSVIWPEDEEQIQQEAPQTTEARGKAKLPNTKLCKQVLQRTSKEAQGIQRNRRKQR